MDGGEENSRGEERKGKKRKVTRSDKRMGEIGQLSSSIKA